MKSMTLRAILMTLSILVATPVQAQQKSGWGLSAGIGASRVRDVDDDDTFDGNSFGYSLEGEFRFSPYFAFGLGGFNLGQASDTFGSVDTEISVKGFGIFGRVIYPLSDTVDLYGRLGGVTYVADLDPGGINSLFGEDALELGLGADIGGGNKLSFRAEGRYFDGPREESGGLVTVGFSYRF